MGENIKERGSVCVLFDLDTPRALAPVFLHFQGAQKEQHPFVLSHFQIRHIGWEFC